MLEKMKERSIDNFMGRVLVKMVELRKEEKQDIKIEEMIFKDYKLFTETISKDFYTKVRKLSLKAFWRQQFTFYQEKRKSVNWDMSEADDVRFVTDLIRKYVPWIYRKKSHETSRIQHYLLNLLKDSTEHKMLQTCLNITITTPCVQAVGPCHDASYKEANS